MATLPNRPSNQKGWGRGLKKSAALGAVLALLLLFIGEGQIVHAASITVTTTDDELNADGDCSLREAVQAANTDAAVDACFTGSGADTIVVSAGTYILSSGELGITTNLSINGAGAATTIIDGAGLSRVFHIFSTTATISGVTIRNGFENGGGGGILNDGTLAIYDSTISSNSSTGWGGAISNGGTVTIAGSMIVNNRASQFGGAIRNDGTLTISNSTIADNRADDGGGGIANLGILTLTNSTVSSNSAFLHAGGIQNMDDLGGGELTITGSSFTGNIAGDGGAILNEASSDITIHNSTFEDNRADSSGAGIANWGTLAIYDSKIKGNNTNVDGGGLYNGSDLGSAGTITLSDSKIEHNSAERGGGIFNDGGTLDIYDSMIKTNSAALTGGGIFNNGGVVTLTKSKVRGNRPDNCVGC